MSAHFALWSPLGRSQLSESTGTSWPPAHTVASAAFYERCPPIHEIVDRVRRWNATRIRGNITFPRRGIHTMSPPLLSSSRENFPDDTLRQPVVLRIPHDPPAVVLKVERQWNYVLSTGHSRILRARTKSSFRKSKGQFSMFLNCDEHCNLRLQLHTYAWIALFWIILAL